ncbi:hypothetical protein HYT59_01130 [Candidatus Woesebacteria bacterium]|nr:hypothetical protein [Candidatus Woesebacteria bacterium]
MAIIIVTPPKKLSEEDFEKAREDYQSYIKITADIENEIVVLGGEYHADAEKKLLEMGSKQENIWGGGYNLSINEVETNAMINIRTGRNDNPEILDAKIKAKFIKLTEKVLHEFI